MVLNNISPFRSEVGGFQMFPNSYTVRQGSSAIRCGKTSVGRQSNQATGKMKFNDIDLNPNIALVRQDMQVFFRIHSLH